MFTPTTQETPAVRSRASHIREVEMEVIFGTPSKNCCGAGVCLITNRFPKGYTVPCPHAPASIHYLPGPELVFRFQKHRLCDRSLQAFFQKKNFRVEEAFSLPDSLQKKWELEGSWVPAGEYPIEAFSREYRLYFPLLIT